MTFDEMSVDKMTVINMSTDKMTVDRMTAIKMSLYKMTVDRMPFRRNDSRQNAMVCCKHRRDRREIENRSMVDCMGRAN